jgi:hypothetical protein
MKNKSRNSGLHHVFGSDDIDIQQRKRDDPLNPLGFGLSSYFDMLWMLILAMLILTLINIPLFKVIADNHPSTVDDQYGGLTIGSLGAANIECFIVKLESKGISLNCEVGRIYNIT